MAQLKLNFSIDVEPGDIDKPVRELLKEFLGCKKTVSGDEDVSVSPLATNKQRVLMDKHKIVYDESTTVNQASELISSFFDSKKKEAKL